MVLAMNKNDWILIGTILILSGALFLIYFLNKSTANIAYVYHANDLIMTIDLTIDKQYEVNGDNGIVKIEVVDNKIRVIEENSPRHLCSKQGVISNSGQSIICLPNKIIIELPNEDIDVEVS